MEIGAHSLKLNQMIRIADNALTFTCAMDANASNHTYPRSTDPYSGEYIRIIAKTATTITVMIGASPDDQQYQHTFVSGVANAITTGGDYAHTFVDALPDAVFTGGGTKAEYFDPNYSSGRNETIQNCANVQAYIATLVDIAGTAIDAGTLDNINALPTITDGTFVNNETLRTIKLAYKDKSSGLFITGDVIKGITSNASQVAIGVNSGLKWIFTSNVTGAFTDNEYITNSRLTNQGPCTQSVIVKNPRVSGSKSIRIPSNGYLTAPDSYDFTFADQAFTIETWLYADALSGTQHIVDFRRTSATSGLRVYLDGTTVRVANGNTTLVSGGTLVPTNWHHIAVVRSTGVTTLYVDGVSVGSTADTNQYLYAPCYVGTSFQQTLGFTGNIDNLVVRKGFADYSAGFTPPTQIDFSRQGISLGLDGEAPFILSTTETFATYTGQYFFCNC